MRRCLGRDAQHRVVVGVHGAHVAARTQTVVARAALATQRRALAAARQRRRRRRRIRAARRQRRIRRRRRHRRRGRLAHLRPALARQRQRIPLIDRLLFVQIVERQLERRNRDRL
jgi:hypothetical protein